jgi:hypothetical protein
MTGQCWSLACKRVKRQQQKKQGLAKGGSKDGGKKQLSLEKKSQHRDLSCCMFLATTQLNGNIWGYIGLRRGGYLVFLFIRHIQQ